MDKTLDSLNSIASRIRVKVAKMYYIAGWGHFAPALSCVDIITGIFFGEDSAGNALYRSELDHFVLSKGHACAALYAAYSELGLIETEELKTFYQDDSRLTGLASPLIDGIDIPTGSLGHGICFATGVALAGKIDNNDSRVFVILGDGESQEGSVWEAAEFAGGHSLSNLIVIMDRNNMQASDEIGNIINDEPIRLKWESFGWQIFETDGHDYIGLLNSLQMSINESNKPCLIIANTIKGKGVSSIEGKYEWHSRVPKGDEWNSVCRDLGIDRENLGEI